MPLDPQAQALLEAMPPIPDFESLGVAAAREVMDQGALAPGEVEEVAQVEDRTLPGPEGEVPVRIYWPEGEGPHPGLVYFHGGGFVIGSVDTHDGTCRSLCRRAGCVVVSVDYRLAPEHFFPAAPEDCYAVTCWVAENAAAIGVDATRLAVAGDSAGGNLAAVVPLMARERQGPALCFQLLIYPVTDCAFDTPSYEQNAEGYFLTRDHMKWFWRQYLKDPADGAHPHASPLRAEGLAGLPPALCITAEFDPLRDEGEAYAARLREAGVAVTASRYDGMFHGFFGMGAVLDQGGNAVEEASAALRASYEVE